MSSIVVSGDTSGAVTLTAPAVAGTVTVTLPSTSGTMALTSSISAATPTALGTVYGATPASNNVALGYNSGTGGSYNTFTGNTAGQNITGSYNNAYGQNALTGASPFTANRNDAFGYASLSAVTSGAYNACFGFLTGLGTTSGQYNTAIGASALQANTTGSYNTAVGALALTANIGAGEYNNAFGWQALKANTTGTENQAFGISAMLSNTTASYNNAMGSNALRTNTTGEQNVAIGYRTMYGNTTASNNTALGARAFETNTTGANNVAVGRASMFSNTTGASNVAVGVDALNNNTVSSYNTVVGYQAGYTHNVTSPINAYGTYFGAFSGYAVTTGNKNSFFGNNSGGGVTTGSGNTIIGGYQGSGAPISSTGNNHIVFSDGEGTVRGYFNGSGSGFFSGATVDYPGSGNTNTGIYLESAGQFCASRDNTVVGRFNRNTSDGTLISFARQGTEQGTISVSGGTVSYNAFAGSHWSQLSDGSKPDILRGTVLDSINELVQWPDEPTTERLCKVKVSDTAGSKKVYGVFMDWDNDWTATNDMYVTAVGAFICRVNASVTVQEGDLLESNGDGTARVQTDDIIRSSTIGKVTCTEKTHQYDDGSYCVPTVLYCG